MPARSAPELLVLHAVRVMGMADVARIALRYRLPGDAVEEHLLDHEARGWVQRVDIVGLDDWTLTAAGRAEGERRLAAELDACGARPVVADAHAGFVRLNEEFLRAITDWQLRHVGRDATVDRPGDWRSDERVLRSLGSLRLRLDPIAAGLAAVLDRFDGYAERLGRALVRVARGDQAYVDGLGVDSCHRVWFELHEDLLATLGLDRGQDG